MLSKKVQTHRRQIIQGRLFLVFSSSSEIHFYVCVQSSRPKTMRDMKQIIKLKKMKKIIKMILTGFLTPVVCLTCLASSLIFRDNCFTLNTKLKIMLLVPNCALHQTLGKSKMVIVSFMNINFEIICQYLLCHGVSVFDQKQISL